MRRAHKRNAILNEKFWFNANFVQSKCCDLSVTKESDYLKSAPADDQKKPPRYEEFYITEILAGKEGSDFCGLFPVICKFMNLKGYTMEQKLEISHMMQFL
jgi:hypothetical protein